MDILVRVLADGLVVPIVLIGTYILLFKIPKTERQQRYGRIIMAGLTALLAAKLVGSFWQPDAARPFIEMGVNAKAAYLDNSGFPSDHVLFCTAITLAVWFEGRQRKVALLLGTLTFLVALGRVLALVHTPLDVAGGVIFASFGAAWYLTQPQEVLSKRIGRRGKRRELPIGDQPG
jgi:undecaprenyl-diphosphatase